MHTTFSCLGSTKVTRTDIVNGGLLRSGKILELNTVAILREVDTMLSHIVKTQEPRIPEE